MEKIALKLRFFPDPVLRRRSAPVKEITARHQEILSGLAQAMYAHSGIGLAAPQVGINQAMIVVDIGKDLYKLVNPKIIKRQESQVMEEGCLSLPGVCIKIRRARRVVVAAEDEAGQALNIEAEGLLACVFQHEIDHLKGRLIVDYASFFQRLKIRRKLANLKKKAKDEKMPESKTESCQLQL